MSNQLRVFVASSSEQVQIAKRVARSLNLRAVDV